MSPLSLAHFPSLLAGLVLGRAHDDQAFLASAADLRDLEHRQRLLDARGRNPFGGIALGLYTR